MRKKHFLSALINLVYFLKGYRFRKKIQRRKTAEQNKLYKESYPNLPRYLKITKSTR